MSNKKLFFFATLIIFAPYIRDMIIITITGDFLPGMFIGFYEDSQIVTLGIRFHRARFALASLPLAITWLFWLKNRPSRKYKSWKQILTGKADPTALPF